MRLLTLTNMRRHGVKMPGLTLLLMVLTAASGQQPPARVPPPIPTNAPGTNAQPEAAVPTFSTTTNLVTEEVTVVDKNGKSVQGLTPEDFIVTENGVPQKINVPAISEHPGRRRPRASNTSGYPVDGGPAGQVDPYRDRSRGSGRSRASRPTPAGSLLRHDIHAAGGPTAGTVLYGKKFIRTQMSPADLMCLMKYDGASVQVLNDFTDDRDKLQSIIETLVVGEGQGFGETSTDAASADNGAQFGQDG